jgi:hypothetical protein
MQSTDLGKVKSQLGDGSLEFISPPACNKNNHRFRLSHLGSALTSRDHLASHFSGILLIHSQLCHKLQENDAASAYTTVQHDPNICGHLASHTT